MLFQAAADCRAMAHHVLLASTRAGTSSWEMLGHFDAWCFLLQPAALALVLLSPCVLVSTTAPPLCWGGDYEARVARTRESRLRRVCLLSRVPRNLECGKFRTILHKSQLRCHRVYIHIFRGEKKKNFTFCESTWNVYGMPLM